MTLQNLFRGKRRVLEKMNRATVELLTMNSRVYNHYEQPVTFVPDGGKTATVLRIRHLLNLLELCVLLVLITLIVLLLECII